MKESKNLLFKIRLITLDTGNKKLNGIVKITGHTHQNITLIFKPKKNKKCIILKVEFEE
jgi:hypothetical protein